MNKKELGIVFVGNHPTEIKRLRNAGYEVKVVDEPCVPFEKTLIIKAGEHIPHELLEFGFGLLDKWDIATPMSAYGDQAYLHGEDSDRKLTKEIVGDLRFITYHTGFIFCHRKNKYIIEDWNQEEGDRTLAFVRTIFKHKPKLCVLPVSWLRSLQFDSNQFISRRGHAPRRHRKPLVKVDLGNGQFVKVEQGQEELVLATLQQRKKKMPIVTNQSSWPLITQATRQSKGALIKVRMPAGNVVKMYEQDAIDQGLIEGVTSEQKQHQKAEDKKRKGDENKGGETVETVDFSEIDGVGKATARKIVENGIRTFEELAEADLSNVLTGKAITAIEVWKNGLHESE